MDRLRAFLALLALAGGLGAAPASASDRAETMGATLRLLIGPEQDGILSAGLEIALKPGWKTYWRTPGDAGVPPVLAVAAPADASVGVAFPAPERFGPDDAPSLGYHGTVILPLTIDLKRRHFAGDVTLTAFLGICRDICVPVEERLTASVGLRGIAPQAAVALASALLHLPQPAVAGTTAHVAEAVADGDGDIRLTVTEPAGTVTDMLVEGNETWQPDQPRLIRREAGRSVWAVRTGRMPRPVPPLRVTLRTGPAAHEQMVAVAP